MWIEGAQHVYGRASPYEASCVCFVMKCFEGASHVHFKTHLLMDFADRVSVLILVVKVDDKAFSDMCMEICPDSDCYADLATPGLIT